MSAGDLADHFEFSKPTMSAHFTVLKEADLVDTHKDGKQVFYQLKLSVLEDALLGFTQIFRAGGADERTVGLPDTQGSYDDDQH